MHTNVIPVFYATGHMAYACSARRYAMSRLPDVMDHRHSRSSPQRATSLLLAIRSTLEHHRPDNRAGANHHHHHWAAVVSRDWAKASACLLQVSLAVLCCPLPDRVAPVFVQVVSSPLGWSFLSSFLVMVSKW